MELYEQIKAGKFVTFEPRKEIALVQPEPVNELGRLPLVGRQEGLTQIPG